VKRLLNYSMDFKDITLTGRQRREGGGRSRVIGSGDQCLANVCAYNVGAAAKNPAGGKHLTYLPIKLVEVGEGALDCFVLHEGVGTSGVPEVVMM